MPLDEPDQQIDRDAKDRQYRADYLAWVASLPPHDRAILRAQGLDRPKVDASLFCYARPETFRESAAAAGLHQDQVAAGEFVHPADLIDGEETIDTDDLERLGKFNPEVLGVLLRVLILPQDGSLRPKAIAARAVALAYALQVDGIGNQSLERLASRIGCTRALLSFLIVQLRDFGKLSHANGKSLEGRAAYAAGQLWSKSRQARARRRECEAATECHSDAGNALTSMLDGKDRQ